MLISIYRGEKERERVRGMRSWERRKKGYGDAELDRLGGSRDGRTFTVLSLAE